MGRTALRARADRATEHLMEKIGAYDEGGLPRRAGNGIHHARDEGRSRRFDEDAE